MQFDIDAPNPRLKTATSQSPGVIVWQALKAIRARVARVRSRVAPLALWLLVLTSGAYMFVGHLDDKLDADGRIQFIKPRSTSGDEPHYLVVINSLIFDHDLRVDPDFARIRLGGYEAGAFWRGQVFGGHSILVNRKTGQSTVCADPCDDDTVANLGDAADLAMFPAHPVGFPAFMALLALPFQPTPGDVEPLVGTFAIWIAIGGVLLVYAAARRSGFESKAAFMAAILLGFASSWLPYARSYFSESSIGLFLLLGFLALRHDRPVLAGLGVGAALAMKSVFALFGFVWIAERVWARRYKDAFWLAASLGTCGLLQLGLNMIMLKSAVTIGSGTFSPAHDFRSLIDTLLHPAQGLLPFVPWAIIPFIWGPIAARPGARNNPGLLQVDARRQLAVPLLAFLAVYSYIGWGPGYCYGPRYWVPLLPFFALLVVDFALAGRAWRTYVVALLAAASMLIAVPGAIKYRRLFIKPPAAAVFYDGA
jgi:hypothetical protein